MNFSLSTLSGSTLLEAAGMLLLFVGFLFLGSRLLPGRRVAGPELEGESRTQKLDGLALFLATVIVGGIAQVSGWFSFSALHTHFAALFLMANEFAFASSGWPYFGEHGFGTRRREPGGGS